MPDTTTIEPEADARILSVEDARARVQQLRDAELELYDRRQKLLDDMAAATAAHGDEILDAIVSGRKPSASRKVSQLRDEVDAIDEAVDRARHRRAEAIPDVWRAEAEEERRQATELLLEAEKRQVRTDELLAALKEHEGCDYIWDSRNRDRPLPIEGTLTWTVPLTERMRNQAARHSLQADQFEAREVSRQGHFEAWSRDELIERIRAWDPFMIAPNLTTVLDWFDQEQAKLTRPFKQALVFWRNGELDLKQSRVNAQSSWEEREASGGIVRVTA